MKYVLPFLKTQKYFIKIERLKSIEIGFILEFWMGLEKSKYEYYSKFVHGKKHEYHPQKCAIHQAPLKLFQVEIFPFKI